VRLNGKIAVVTGAASGIGRAISELFAEEGAVVYATDIVFPEKSTQLQSLIRIQHDVSDEDQWRALVSRVEAEQGRLSVLVNNAGIVGSYDPIDCVSMETYLRVVAVNQHGPFFGIRTCVPLMKKSGGGSIVNISSIWGLIGAVGVAAYQVSKGAVTCMTKNAALTYAPLIRANSIHPGIIRTAIIERQDPAMNQVIVDDTPLKRMAEPREVAYAALYLASDEAAFVTGAELVIDGGYTIR
jgi:NAD(P)-dependent dehydrogenase (short-subunit alcohol dehydrogenase family)